MLINIFQIMTERTGTCQAKGEKRGGNSLSNSAILVLFLIRVYFNKMLYNATRRSRGDVRGEVALSH
jgi:hypothetical protein